MSSVVLISAVVFRLVSSHGVRFSLCHPFRLVSQNSRHFFHRYLAPIGLPSSIAPLLVVSWRMEGARARRRRREVNEGGGRVGKGVIEGGGWHDLAVTRWGRAMEREGRACRSRRGRGCLRAQPRRHEVGEGEEKGRGGVVVVVVRAGEGTTSSSRVVSGVLTYYTFTVLLGLQLFCTARYSNRARVCVVFEEGTLWLFGGGILDGRDRHGGGDQ
ncbi:hypothetical protein EV363DRAFT_1300778 [Boletus edulis]|nr:hypothetical protein EV363DRAFT_1300778 [Boletus edulis]